jgi:3-deoxy-alpha-D-manno-octulosonate 8-oxidase
MKNAINVKNYYIGTGSISKLEELLNNKRVDSDSIVVFMIDDFFYNNSIIDTLPINKNDEKIFVKTDKEPYSNYIDELVNGIKERNYKDNIVAVIGMGGGTTMDIAKATAILLRNDGLAQDYQGWELVKNPAVYKIGIPTISGTGAEVTKTAVMTSPIKKLGINSDYTIFDQIILDPSLLKSVPKEQFIYTAMDSYVHCVESLRGHTNDAMTIAYAEKSLELLREIFTGEMDYEKLMVASAFGGMAVTNSNVGICHPLSYGLSLVKELRHGFAICVAFNHLEEYYPEVTEFREFLKKMDFELPTNVLAGTTEEEFDKMAEATLKNEIPLENAFGPNWKEIFSKEIVIEILKKI